MSGLLMSEAPAANCCGATKHRPEEIRRGQEIEATYVCQRPAGHEGQHQGARVLEDGSLDSAWGLGWSRSV